jgi:hypothetical protein
MAASMRLLAALPLLLLASLCTGQPSPPAPATTPQILAEFMQQAGFSQSTINALAFASFKSFYTRTEVTALKDYAISYGALALLLAARTE